jgi:hypothetical protein
MSIPGSISNSFSPRFARLRLLLLTLLASIAPLTAPTAEAVDRTEAIWRSQQLPLDYLAHNTFYSCAELATRVVDILRVLGTRSQIGELSGCDDFAQRQQISVRITAPMEASPENVHAATTFSSTERLLAELRHLSLPTATDIERFPSEWLTIRVARIGNAPIAARDCELLRTMNRQLFSKLSIRSSGKAPHCGFDGSSIPTQFTFDTLVRIPPERLAHAAGSGD